MKALNAMTVFAVAFLASGYLAEAQGQNYLRDPSSPPPERHAVVPPAAVEPAAVEPAPVQPAVVEPSVAAPTQVEPVQPAEQAVLVETPATVEAGPSAADRWSEQWDSAVELLHGHLEVGTRITYYSLTDDTKGQGGGEAFLGQISKLDAEQDYAPTRWFIDVMYNQYVGVEITWDKMRAETINRNGGSDDGFAEMDGWFISVIGRYPNETIFTPYAGLGVAFLSSTFDHADWWHLNYPDAETYAAAGSPGTPHDHYTRTITVEDVTAFPISAGCAVELTEKWSLDVYFRYTAAEADASFVKLFGARKVVESAQGSFDFSNYALGIGAKYVF